MYTINSKQELWVNATCPVNSILSLWATAINFNIASSCADSLPKQLYDFLLWHTSFYVRLFKLHRSSKAITRYLFFWLMSWWFVSHVVCNSETFLCVTRLRLNRSCACCSPFLTLPMFFRDINGFPCWFPRPAKPAKLKVSSVHATTRGKAIYNLYNLSQYNASVFSFGLPPISSSSTSPSSIPTFFFRCSFLPSKLPLLWHISRSFCHLLAYAFTPIWPTSVTLSSSTHSVQVFASPTKETKSPKTFLLKGALVLAAGLVVLQPLAMRV